MFSTQTALAALRRPRILISAARFGVAQYNREVVLGRIFGASIPGPGDGCVDNLIVHEAALEEARKTARGDYSIARHVDALAAIMVESRQLAACACPAPSVLDGDVIAFAPRAKAVS